MRLHRLDSNDPARNSEIRILAPIWLRPALLPILGALATIPSSLHLLPNSTSLRAKRCLVHSPRWVRRMQSPALVMCYEPPMPHQQRIAQHLARRCHVPKHFSLPQTTPRLYRTPKRWSQSSQTTLMLFIPKFSTPHLPLSLPTRSLTCLRRLLVIFVVVWLDWEKSGQLTLKCRRRKMP